MATNDLYNRITDQIIQSLERGTAPWRKPWAVGLPRNGATNRQYHGINVLVLATAGYSDPRWVTFLQAKQLGGHIKKGEHGTLIVYFGTQTVTEETDEGETEKLRRVRKAYTLFNLEQTEDVNLPPLEHRTVDVIEQAEEIIRNYPNPPSIAHDGGTQAYYKPIADSIHLPPRDSFESAPEYYSTAYHEMGHSTGHKSRLDRATLTEPAPFGSPVYSREELTAEITSAFLMGHIGMDASTIENSAAYLQGWLKALKNDKSLIVHAAADAQRAADYITGAAA